MEKNNSDRFRFRVCGGKQRKQIVRESRRESMRKPKREGLALVGRVENTFI